MPQTTIGRGNMVYDWLIAPSVTWAAVAGNTTAEQNITLNGLMTGDYVDFFCNVAQTTGLQVVNIRVASNNTLTVQWVNSTGGSLTPVAGVYTFNIGRPEAPNNMPTNAN